MVTWLGLLAGLVLALTSCTKTSSVRCGDAICPPDTHCGPANECVPDTCGDGQFVSSGEVCDGDDSVTQSQLRCSDFGFYTQSGPLTCSETCEIDTSVCSETCGDHTINGEERCDGLPPTGAACADYGFDVGRLGCTDACEPAFDHCTSVGWRLLPGGATDELHAVFLASPSAGVAVGRGGQIIAAKDGVWIPVVSPTTEDLEGVFGNAAGLIAVGHKGTILRYDGTTVSTMASPTTEDLFGISGGAVGAFAVGAGGTILRYDNSTWTTMTSPVNSPLRAVYALDATTAYAVGDGGVVLKWNGTVWTKLNVTGLPTPNLLAVRVFPGGMVFVGGDPPMGSPIVPIARIVNDSTAVVPSAYPDGLSSVPVRAIWGESPNALYVAGGSGRLMFWNGTFLSAQDTGTDRTIYGLTGIGTRVVGVTRGGAVIGTNGSSTRVDELFLVDTLYALFTDGVRTVAGGNGLALMRGTDGRWQTITTPSPSNVLRGVFAAGTDIWAIEPIQNAAEGHIYRSTAGASFTNVFTANTGETISAIWGTPSPLRIIAVGSKIWQSADGATFTASPAPNGTTILYDVWGAPDGTWFTVGDNGLVLRRAPGASTWTTLPTNVPNRLLSVWGSSANDVFAVGTFGLILHWDGTAWRRMYTGVAENLVAVSGNSASDVFVSGTGLLRLHYDGLSWSRMPSLATDFDVASAGGTTFRVYGGTIERFTRGDVAVETACTDAWDNDSDGKTNCDDMDCADEAQCRRGGACETQQRVTCGTTELATSSFSGIARIDALPCLDHLTPGPEASYRYVAETSGSVTVTVTTTDPAAALDLVVTDAVAGHCALDTCRSATQSGATQAVTFQATAGQMYYIVVDGPVGVAQPFTLSLGCN